MRRRLDAVGYQEVKAPQLLDRSLWEASGHWDNFRANMFIAHSQDDRVLAEMTKRVFSAGFAWSVIESKWPGFEEAFLGFEPARLAFEPDEFWERLTKDARIVRNGAKILSVRANARFLRDVAREHASKFGWSATVDALLQLYATVTEAAAVDA